MSIPFHTVSELPAGAEGIPPAAMAVTRPMYWSIRRELWENRSVYMAPLIVAGVALFSFLISTVRLAKKMRGLEALDPARQMAAIAKPYDLAASVILFTGIVVGAFYCLEALHGERRDRSILFWKSLPVSDRTAVLSKASIPLVFLPLFGFALAQLVQFVMLIASTLVLLANGIHPARLWSRMPLFEMALVMFYGLTAHILWYAPLYSWLLLVSAWAKRATFLWAVLPFALVGVIERLAFGTSYFGNLLKYRMKGAMIEAFSVDPAKSRIDGFSQLEPVRFLTSPGLWLGLLFAAACLAAAIRLRRNRAPI